MSEYLQLLEQRKSLETLIESAYQAERGPAIAEARRLIMDYEISPDECGFVTVPSVDPKPAKKIRKPAAVKYAGPNGEKWTGRGKTPAWMQDAIANGRQLDEFSVEP